MRGKNSKSQNRNLVKFSKKLFFENLSQPKVNFKRPKKLFLNVDDAPFLDHRIFPTYFSWMLYIYKMFIEV